MSPRSNLSLDCSLSSLAEDVQKCFGVFSGLVEQRNIPAYWMLDSAHVTSTIIVPLFLPALSWPSESSLPLRLVNKATYHFSNSGHGMVCTFSPSGCSLSDSFQIIVTMHIRPPCARVLLFFPFPLHLLYPKWTPLSCGVRIFQLFSRH